MKGHGEKSSYRREHAIAALLTCQTIGEAVQACNVAPVTLWRWLQDASFSAQSRAAREQVVEHAISDLLRSSTRHGRRRRDASAKVEQRESSRPGASGANNS